MDSSNYLHSHYHHLHDQKKHLANGSPSSPCSSSPSSPSIDNNNPSNSSTSSSCFGVVLHDSHQWTPNTTLINSNYKLTTPPNSEAIPKPSSTSSSSPHENYNPMSQNPSGFQWPELGDIPTNNNTFPKFTDMLINGTTSTNILDDDLQLCPSSYMKSNSDLSVELSQKLMLKTLLSSTSRAMEDDEFHFTGTGGKGFVFSQIHPSVNISSPTSNNNYQSSSSSSWPTFDLLSSARFSDDQKRFSGNSLWSERESGGNCGIYDHGKEELYRSSSSSSFDHESSRSYGDRKTVDAKRPSSSVEAKAPIGSKKTRVESRPSSCPPMKVRKEKLGDRIAALQQLVAPFGKTDTASVLMEAIGYIKFLQNQIQTLSVPYMKSQRNDNNRTSQRGNGDATKPDLKSRGLCLVPLTCMSYVTNDGTGVWPPPNFRGGI